MYGFWGAILVFGMVRRLFHTLRQRTPSASDSESGRANSTTTRLFRHITTWARKHLITPSMLPPYHIQPLLGCTVPTRLEFIIIYLYYVISIVLCAVNYRGFEGNILYVFSFFSCRASTNLSPNSWAKVPPQTWRYLADRTGIICYANLPILWMFSGRNNIFIWLTGWEFSVFNLFHRHIARVATLQAIIHSVAYTVFYYASGDC